MRFLSNRQASAVSLRCLRGAGLLGIVLLAGMSVSCGQKTRLAAYPAKGKVLIDDKPAKDVFVYFIPTGTSAGGAYSPSGQTDEEGRFVLSTYEPGDGAPVGEYTVTVEWPEKLNIISGQWEGDRLKGRYSDPQKSTLKRRIEAKENEVEPLLLKK